MSLIFAEGNLAPVTQRILLETTQGTAPSRRQRVRNRSRAKAQARYAGVQ